MVLAPPEAEPTTDVLTVLKTREVVDILERTPPTGSRRRLRG